jgi:hypothetical protein
MALSMGFFLCERYYRFKSHTINNHRNSTRFLRAAARDFDCNEDLFKAFWSLFRNGVQHQGAPKKQYKAFWLPGEPTIRIKWAIGDMLPHRPAYISADGVKRIGICPWKFTAFMLKKFLENERALKSSVSHGFGQVLAQPATLPIITELPFK